MILLGSQESDPVDRVRAFDRGCDDYLDRPFHYDELVARIRAVLRRVAPPEAERLEAGEIEIDRPTRRVTVVAGERVLLPTKEYELLLKLASDPRRVFTKDELLREVWGFRSTWADAHARLARLTSSSPAHEARRHAVRPERLGRRLLPARRLSQSAASASAIERGKRVGVKWTAPPGTRHGMTLTEKRPAITAGSCSLSSPSPCRVDVQDGEAAVLRVVERPCREQVAGLVQVGQVRHVCVLELRRSLVVELGRIRT